MMPELGVLGLLDKLAAICKLFVSIYPALRGLVEQALKANSDNLKNRG